MSQLSFPTFNEWMKVREGVNDGKPKGVEGMKKVTTEPHKGDIHSGTRSHCDDLSKDYKGHVEDGGDTQQKDVKKQKGNKPAGDVAK